MDSKEIKALEKSAFERILKQRMALVLRQPFFGSLALRLKVQVAWWQQTAAVDGKHLFFNPAFIQSLTDAQLKGLVCHEVLHCANGHPWRRDNREPQLFNIACDYAINPIVLAAGMELPEDGCVDDRFKAMSAEQIYAFLRDQRSQSPKPQHSGAGAGGAQGGAGEPDDQADDAEGSGDAEGKDGAGKKPPKGKGSNKPANGGQDNASPSGQDGPGQTDPRTPKYKPTFGEVMDAPLESAHQDEANWRVAVIQAMEAAKAQGKLPAGAERLVQEFVEPRIDWRAVLRRFVQQLAALDYTWRMPSPRYAASGMYLPRLQSEQMPPIVVAVDTSGSIGSAELAEFTAEVSAIIEEVKPEMTHLVFCDAKVGSTQEFVPGDPLVYKPTGGGGTSFIPVFEWVEEQGIDPACLIYLTDMMGTFPEEAPAYPTLWASSTKLESLSQHYHAPFGETLYIGA